MIEITTLLLGLISGPWTVEMAAAPQVAAVVLELDGRVAVGARPEDGRAEVEVSLGPTLLPHRLTAVGYDEVGREIGRDDEWVNLPRPEIDAELVLHGDPWAPERASLVWDQISRERVTVRRVEADLDGSPVPVEDPADFAIPPVDPERVHVLRLRVTYSNGERIELARSLGGGGLIDEVETRLVPLRLAPRPGEEWPEEPGDLAACLEAAGDVDVDGWEAQDAEVFVVRDTSDGEKDLRRLRLGMPRRIPGVLGQPSFESLLPLAPVRLSHVWPFPTVIAHRGRPARVFPTTRQDDAAGRGLASIFLESHERQPEEVQRLAEAVALAGMLAYGSGRPSAVVLLVGDEPPDASDRSPREARAYLEALHVPLHVWSLAGQQSAGAWGPAVPVRTFPHLERAVADLRREVRRQRLVWLTGVALPQDVRITGCACCRSAHGG